MWYGDLRRAGFRFCTKGSPSQEISCQIERPAWEKIAMHTELCNQSTQVKNSEVGSGATHRLRRPLRIPLARAPRG